MWESINFTIFLSINNQDNIGRYILLHTVIKVAKVNSICSIEYIIYLLKKKEEMKNRKEVLNLIHGVLHRVLRNLELTSILNIFNHQF